MEVREVFPAESHSSRKGWLYVSKCSLNIFNNLLVSNICSYSFTYTLGNTYTHIIYFVQFIPYTCIHVCRLPINWLESFLSRFQIWVGGGEAFSKGLFSSCLISWHLTAAGGGSKKVWLQYRSHPLPQA